MNYTKLFLLFVFFFVVFFRVDAQSAIDTKQLLLQMTLKEKIGQLNQVSVRNNIEQAKESVRKGDIGSVLNLDTEIINKIQRVAVEESRLGIPLIFARDVIHGYKTIFPIPLGLAASFDPEIVRLSGEVAAREASSQGIRWTFAPMIDISRDARWGRIAESFGEDPYLTSVLGVAMVKGFQGNNLSAPTSVASCAKHFVGYGASEGGRDYNLTSIPERLLRNVYLPPFKALADAGVATFMTSFNDNDGVPMTGNKDINVNILRNEWDYNKVIVSDWAAIKEMINHGFSSNLKGAAKKAIEANVDIDMMSLAYSTELENLVAENPHLMELIDKAVLRVLNLKAELGLFINPYVNTSKEVLYAPAHLNAAKIAAEKSMVLLKNDNMTLPIKEAVKKIAIIGPLADAPHDQMGTWVFDGEKEHTRTPLNALKRLYGHKVSFEYAKILVSPLDYSTAKFGNAVSLAQKSDLILLFVGEASILSGEAHCLADINLHGAQSQLVSELAKTGKPVVMVVMAGRPLTIENEYNLCDAVLYAWHPGTMGGDAIADVLFGKINPSAKLPVTFPRHVGQIPIYYNHNNTGRPAPDNVKTLKDIDIYESQNSLGNTSFYMDYGKNPFLPFGYGLSYTTFKYNSLELNKNEMAVQNDSIITRVKLTNIGEYVGTEVVQLYVQDVTASITRPVKELKRFKRITLNPDESIDVEFTLYSDDFAFWGIDNKAVIEPGGMKLWIGGDSESGLKTFFLLK